MSGVDPAVLEEMHTHFREFLKQYEDRGRLETQIRAVQQLNNIARRIAGREADVKRIIAVDLDGTLAHYDKWISEDHIGAPIEPMVRRVREWLSAGHDVRIFTARARIPSAIPPIERWCAQYFGQVLRVTNTKEHDVNEFWDDRAIQVERNTGTVLGVEP